MTIVGLIIVAAFFFLKLSQAVLSQRLFSSLSKIKTSLPTLLLYTLGLLNNFFYRS